ncbi:MAG: hypothetical protein ACXWVQ_10160 [Methyloceanibacter sp.]
MSNPIHDAVEPDADPASRDQADRGSLGIHPIVFKTVIAATVWFLAVAWLAFARGAETDYLLVIVTLFFVIFLTLFLLTATYSRGDARWPTKRASFREFLNGTVSTATGDERGRDVLIEIAALPVVLAVGATLIGLAWVIFG